MKPTLNNARDLLKKYNEKYITNFELGKEYALYPESDDEYGFKDCWPCNEQAGVYLILDENKEVIYVGQAKILGIRFYYHFKPVDGKCVLRGQWRKKPKYIVALPAPDDAKYERLSLEEYLIQNLQPIDNTLGK